MTGVSVDIDDRQVKDALSRLIGQVTDLRPVLDKLAQVVVTRADLSFRGQQSPDGEPWQKLSAVTLRRRRGSSAQILKDTGRLASSISAQPASAHEVIVGTNVEYAAVHQFGNPANRMYNTPRGNPAPIPPRPFLPTDGLPDEDRDAMIDITSRTLMEAVHGG